ncbi:MAG: DUF1049 domain-containing protein [Betaproteobacteria bacterium]|nr:DUF1049 domain-containing protein [Betaproteobacteria bacterium]
MRARTLFLFLILALIATFAIVNLDAFLAPTPLSLVFTTIHAPLGLVMLALMGVLVIVFLVFVVYMQSTVLVESRRHTRELKEQRTLADKAEASRFTDLREYLAAELSAMRAQATAVESKVLTRLEQIEERHRAALEQTGNTLAAYIGELEDHLERGAGANPDDRPD